MPLRFAFCASLAFAFVVACSSTVPSVSSNPAPQPSGADRCSQIPIARMKPGSVYRVPDGANDLTTKCTVQAAIADGAFVVAYGAESAFLDVALGAKPAGSNATQEIIGNGTPGPRATLGPVPSPLPTWPPGKPTPSPFPSATAGPIVTIAHTARGMVREDGVLQTYDVADNTREELDADLADWEAHPLSGATPPPANKVWSLIGMNRQDVPGPMATGFAAQDVTPPPGPTGHLHLRSFVWRLNTHDRNHDYFMVSSVMSSNPHFQPGVGNECWDFCQWWTWRRNQVLSLRDVNGASAITDDLGPPNGIQEDEVSFSIGGSLGGKIGFSDKGASGEGNVGINSTYSTKWKQLHAKTTSLSNIGATTGTWQDDTLNFMTGDYYDWYAWKNITTTAAFTNQRAAIFVLPRNADPTVVTPDLTNYFLVRASTCLQPSACILNEWVLYKEIHLTSTQKWQVWLPTFSVDTKEITLQPKATATFKIRVRSSVGEEAKEWQIVKDPNDNHLTVSPNSGTDSRDRSEYQTIKVKAQPGAVPGSTYTLYVNTVPAGGADSLRSGSLLVKVHID